MLWHTIGAEHMQDPRLNWMHRTVKAMAKGAVCIWLQFPVHRFVESVDFCSSVSEFWVSFAFYIFFLNIEAFYFLTVS